MEALAELVDVVRLTTIKSLPERTGKYLLKELRREISFGRFRNTIILVSDDGIFVTSFNVIYRDPQS